MTTTDQDKLRLGMGCVVVAIIFLLLIPVLGVCVEHFALGWLYFPLRVIPQMTFDWPALAASSVAIAAFVVVLHATLKWLASLVASGDGTEPGRWSWRGTLAVSLLVLILFAAGTAMVGATHQVVWMASGVERESNSSSAPSLGFVGAARDAARRVQLSNNMKQLEIGLLNFHDVYNSLPPGGTMTESGELLHGWVGLTNFYLWFGSEEFDYRIPWNQPPNDRIYKCNLPFFVNPSLGGPHFDSEGFGLAHIAGNIHVLPIRTDNLRATATNGDGPLDIRVRGVRLSDIHDTSDTILLGTVGGGFKPWGHPANLRDPSTGLGTSSSQFGGPRHWRGAQFVMCDGSTRFIARDVDPKVLAALGRP